MKKYYEYKRECIGMSDIASLIMCGPEYDETEEYKDVTAKMLHFGVDSTYYAYIVDEDAEIGAHYLKVASFRTWLNIYDDEELMFKTCGWDDIINVYRAGDYGCIIQIIKSKK